MFKASRQFGDLLSGAGAFRHSNFWTPDGGGGDAELFFVTICSWYGGLEVMDQASFRQRDEEGRVGKSAF